MLFAITSKHGGFLSFNYNDRYGMTFVEEVELDLFNAQDVLFSNIEYARYEVTAIKEDPSYKIDGIEIGDIVEVEISFDFKINKKGSVL